MMMPIENVYCARSYPFPQPTHILILYLSRLPEHNDVVHITGSSGQVVHVAARPGNHQHIPRVDGRQALGGKQLSQGVLGHGGWLGRREEGCGKVQCNAMQ